MSTISGYFLPNKIANEYVASKRNEEGAYEYDTYLQDVGMQTQAAIQSLNKSYSDTINNAYSQYLNSKRTILNSNMIQGAKEAYLQNQQEALQQNLAQASLTSAETKQQILQQAYEQQNAIGKTFQNEVTNMEQVGTMLSGYMEYLKGVTNGSGSYYDAIISGKGLTDYAKDNRIYAEDLYDELYNAQPGLKDNMYTDEDGNVALGWTDWLNTQIKTDKQQAWYDWYMGAGGYEQFQDAYKKGIYGSTGVSDYLTEQKKKADYNKARTDAEDKYKKEKYDAQVAYDTEVKKIDSEIDKIDEMAKMEFDWYEGGFFDFNQDINSTYKQGIHNLRLYGQRLGLSDEEIIQAIASEFPGAAYGQNTSYDRTDIPVLFNTLKKLGKGYAQQSLDLAAGLLKNAAKEKAYKKAGIGENPKYSYKKFEFPSYEDYYK